jgi:hypothetical protein
MLGGSLGAGLPRRLFALRRLALRRLRSARVLLLAAASLLL